MRDLGGLHAAQRRADSALYNSYNFSINADSPFNSTVNYSAISVMSCPSDNQKVRPAVPWAPTNYHGNYGGPDVVRMWSGTIVPFYNLTSANNVGTRAGLGLVGCRQQPGLLRLRERHRRHLQHGALQREAPRDVQQRTLPLRRLLSGCQAGDLPRQLPYTYNSLNAAYASRASGRARGLPGPRRPVAIAGSHGFSWAIGYQWHWVVNNYNHYDTPNKLACLNPAEITPQGWGGYAGMSPPTSNHPGGVNVCFSDGSVHFVKDSVSPQTWWALGTRNGGETVSSTRTEQSHPSGPARRGDRASPGRSVWSAGRGPSCRRPFLIRSPAVAHDHVPEGANVPGAILSVP